MKKVKVFYLVAVLALLSISIVTFSGITRADTVPDAFVEYVSEGRYFNVTLPSGWSKKEENVGLSAEEKKVYGVALLSPISKDGIASMIAVHYYAPGNSIETMERFIIINTWFDGREYEQVKDDRVAGRPAKVFERKMYEYIAEYIPPDSFKHKKIAVYYRFVVLSANKGFYVLWYSAPEDIAEEYQGVFDKVISSFEPLTE